MAQWEAGQAGRPQRDSFCAGGNGREERYRLCPRLCQDAVPYPDRVKIPGAISQSAQVEELGNGGGPKQDSPVWERETNSYGSSGSSVGKLGGAKTLEAVSGLMNLVMLPMWVLSGIFFSSERFPDVAQPFIKLVPLTPLIDALRAVMLEGATLASQWGELLTLALWGGVSFALALRFFRWS